MKVSQRTLGVQGRGPTKQLLIAEQSTLIDPCSRYHAKHLTCACTCAQLLKLHPTLCDPLDCSPQAPQSTGLSRQEYWSGWLCPPPGDLPNSRIQPKSPMAPALVGRFFTTEPPGKPLGISPAWTQNITTIPEASISTPVILWMGKMTLQKIKPNTLGNNRDSRGRNSDSNARLVVTTS